MPAGGVGACPDNEPTRQATRQHTRSHRREGRRRAVRGLAAVPVGGGGAWPGFEATRRAKLAARTARGRAAAHGHTKQPGPTTHHSAPGTPVDTNTSPTHRTSNGHMKPVTPLQAVIIRNLKPQTPLLSSVPHSGVTVGGRPV